MKCNNFTVFFMKIFLCFVVFISYFGASVWSIDLGFVQLSFFRICVLIMPILYFYKLVQRHSDSSYLKNWRCIRYPEWFFGFWFLYSILSVLWAPSLHDAVRNIYFIGCGYVTIITFSSMFDEYNDIYYCILAGFYAIFVHSVIGWHEVITGQYLFDSPYLIEYAYAALPVSSFFNVNGFATVILFGIFFSYIIWKKSTSKILSMFSLLIMLEMVVLLLWSRSRANIIGLLCAWFIVILTNKRKLVQNLSVAIVISTFTIGIIAFLFPDFYKTANDLAMNEIFHVDLLADSGSDYIRKNLIRNGFMFLKNTLLMGTGAGGIESYMATDWFYPTDGITNMHNWWMEILTGYGIFVFTGYIVFYTTLLFSMFRAKITTGDHLFCGLLGLLLAFPLASVSSSSNIANDNLWTFWGWMIVLLRIAHNEPRAATALAKSGQCIHGGADEPLDSK